MGGFHARSAAGSMMIAVHPENKHGRSGPVSTGSLRGVIFAGGGTGGHIFPGIAIAERLEAASGRGGVVCEFAVSGRPLDGEILRKAGRRFRVNPAQPVSVRPRGFLRFAMSWGKAVGAGREMIRQLRKECPGGVEVVAMGGFVAAPVVRAAVVERAPITLVNLDAVPGRANRWISGRAGKVFSTAPVREGSLRAGTSRQGSGGVALVPPIVRAEARAPGDAAECRRRLGLDAGRLTLMVTGASQGAKSINSLMLALAEREKDLLVRGGWQIVHQTGRGEAERVRAGYAAAGVPAVVEEFFDGMGALWGAADLAVSRSGAGSVAEAWGNGTPTVFLPYPYHKDQHQKHNAQGVVAAGGAIVVDDLIEPAANVERAGAEIASLLADAGRRAEMRKGYERLGPADGEVRIAQGIMAAWR